MLAQQAAGPHHEHEHDEHERDGVAKLRHFEADDAVDDPEQKSADDGAGEARESAHHGRRECLERDVAHHAGVEVVERGDQHAGHRAHGRAHSPPEGIHPTDADTHQLCGRSVLRDGAHGDPRRAETEEGKEDRHQNERHQEGQRVQLAHHDRREAQGRAGHRCGKGPYLVAPDPTRGTEQDEAQPDRDDHWIQDRGRADVTQYDTLDERSEHPSEGQGQDECDGERELKDGQEREGHECAEHRCLALREGDDLGRFVDQDDAESGQCVQAAERQPVDEQLSPRQVGEDVRCDRQHRPLCLLRSSGRRYRHTDRTRHAQSIRTARSAKSSATAVSVSRPPGRYQRWTQVQVPRSARVASLESRSTKSP